MVEEQSQGVEAVATSNRGALGRDYAGMSSDKTGVKPVRRKPKVSRGRLIRPGLVGPKPRLKKRRRWRAGEYSCTADFALRAEEVPRRLGERVIGCTRPNL